VMMENSEAALEYRHSCSRLIIGRVVRGDYSFTQAQGISFGYCSLAALEELNKDGLVLVRNTTSKFYHPTRLGILIGQYGI